MDCAPQDDTCYNHAVREVASQGDTIYLDLWYPRTAEPNKVELGLMDVRAADSLQIEYDFERDGWSIRQASTFSWDADDKIRDPDWQEVAFVQAWAREKEEKADDR